MPFSRHSVDAKIRGYHATLANRSPLAYALAKKEQNNQPVIGP